MSREQHPSAYGTPMPTRAPSIAEECEAFLGGWFTPLHTALGGEVEGWMALNRTAHGDAAIVRLIARGEGDTSPWMADEQQVARALVTHSADDDDLRTIQQIVLVPLELWLAGPGRAVGLSPHGALVMATEAINEYIAD
jgi:hypothetical protein